MMIDPLKAAIDIADTTSREILTSAIEIIDTQFGTDYSIKNPVLVAAVVSAQTEIVKSVIIKNT